MRTRSWLVPAWIGSALILPVFLGAAICPASAQKVILKPRAGAAGGTGAVSVTMQGTDVYAAVTGGNADVRAVFRDLADKSKTKILLAPTASGTVSRSVPSQPLELTIRGVAEVTGLSVRKILVPQAIANTLTAESAAPLAGALADTTANATVVDPASGRSVTLTFATAPPKPDAGLAAVYYISRVPRHGQAVAATGDAAQDAVANALASFSQLPADQRFRAIRDLQRQLFQSMTPEDREQMRGQFPGRGPGAFGERGGPGGQGGPDGYDGPPPGNPGNPDDGSAPAPPPAE